MKYIKKVTLKNFQSHKYTELDLTSSLNIVVGASDSGKTSILRAIKWVLYNEPLGDFFIRKGTDECSVQLEFNDLTKVVRYRNKSKNQYRVIKGDNVDVYEGFGSLVPDEVMEATGIKKIYLDQDQSRSINLAEQLDGPFLLSEKGSTKAASIGRLVGANIIDDALKYTLLDIRRLNSRKADYKRHNEEIKSELDEFQYLDSLELKLDRLEINLRELRKAEELRFKLKSIGDNYRMVKGEIAKYEETYRYFSRLDSVKSNIEELDKYLLNLKMSFLNRDRLEGLKEDIKLNLALSKGLANVEEISPLIFELEKNIDKLSKASEVSRAYKTTKLRLEKNLNISNQLDKLSSIDERYRLLSLEINRYKSIVDLSLKYKDLREKLNVGNKYLSDYKNLNQALENLNELEHKLDLLQRLKTLKLIYADINSSIDKGRLYMDDLLKNIEHYLLEYTALLSQKKICPYCYSEITKKHLDQIIFKYMKELEV